MNNHFTSVIWYKLTLRINVRVDICSCSCFWTVSGPHLGPLKTLERLQLICTASDLIF